MVQTARQAGEKYRGAQGHRRLAKGHGFPARANQRIGAFSLPLQRANTFANIVADHLEEAALNAALREACSAIFNAS